MEKYDFKEVERKWQEFWESEGIFKVSDNPKKKFYLLCMFPYPSGDMHMGHLRNYVIGDTIARYKWMRGYQVLHPMGWDAFGLPAENAAILRGIHPREWTMNNIEKSRKSLKLVGISYDWDREVISCNPDYYKWTQWLFLQLYKSGLAYKKEAYVNWCPGCQTVLANEQVIEGRCWRCGSQVGKKSLNQWFIKITAYAERLLNDLKKLKDWPDEIKRMQEYWIGRSEGAEIDFEFDGGKISVFTTRPDTVFGVTFLAIAPEHPVAIELSKKDSGLSRFIEDVLRRPEYERQFQKNGYFTGKYVINPVNGERVPLYVADYVLPLYGTGAVMGVPAHDQRDFEFAQQYNLPVKQVIKPKEGEWDFSNGAFTEKGIMINSGEFTGKTSEEAIPQLIEWFNEKGFGRKKVTYRLRDWLISRQRYWGAPIPIIYCEKCGIVPVPEEDLPVLLPEVKDYAPRGKSPLASVPEFVNTKCPKCGGEAKRDTDTMDTFMCSSWYFLRYIDPKNDKKPFEPEKVKIWMPIDLYIGGAEHATGHLLYFRFMTKFLYDKGWVNVDEPAIKLFNQGMVKDEKGQVMSKSKGNVVEVGPFVEKEGADVARLAILFMGPPDKDGIWMDKNVTGARRFIRRLFNFFEQNIDKVTEREPDVDSPVYRLTHKYIKRITQQIENFGLNTGIASLMEFLNELQGKDSDPAFGWALFNYIKLLAPFAPHLAEELWHKIGKKESVFRTEWPSYKEIKEEKIKIVVQVNSKVRGEIEVPADAGEEEIKEKALSHWNVKRFTEGKEIKRIIYVKGKLLNIVCA